jgi:1,2-diacylglycerol 3-alpha-glucosyltransferase
MKIVHLCLSGPYNDNWGYQDNLLPLYQQKLGHDVTVIATNTMHGPKGPIVQCDEGDYRLENGLRIIRVSVKPLITKKLGQAYGYFHVYNLLKSLKPDYIMVHGLVSITALQAIKYKKKINPNCIIVAYTHTDYNNSPQKNTLKNKMYFLSLVLLNKITAKHYKRIFGVTPWRVAYANDVYRIPLEKIDLLPLGGDTDIIEWNKQEEIRTLTRNKYSVNNSDFVVASGGKMDEEKNIHNLIKAIGETNKSNVKLIIFGSIADEYREKITHLLNQYKKQVNYVGFLTTSEIYKLFIATDLAVFPGGHSVLWEQAIACGVPTIFKWWPKMEYLDLGGNTIFLEKADYQEIKSLIETLEVNRSRLEEMRVVAQTNGYEVFSYRKIAQKSLE